MTSCSRVSKTKESCVSATTIKLEYNLDLPLAYVLLLAEVLYYSIIMLLY